MRRSIDINRALELKSAGYKHREIGVQIALEMGRRVPFQAISIQKVLRLARLEEECDGRT